MKKYLNLILIQVVLSIISGILIYKMSLIGRIGIHLLFRKYMIFRSLVENSIIITFDTRYINIYTCLCKKFQLQKESSRINYIMVLGGIIGLFATYLDFTITSHRLMKNQFSFRILFVLDRLVYHLWLVYFHSSKAFF